jgi:hypothetical protein
LARSCRTRTRSQSFAGARLLILLFALSLFSGSALLLRAQERPSHTAKPDCTAADLEITFGASSGPDQIYTFAVLFKNISNNGCLLMAPAPIQLRSTRYAPGTADLISFRAGGVPIPTCDGCKGNPPSMPPCEECETNLAPRDRSGFNSIFLDPEKTAHQLLRWKTTATDDAACYPLLDMFYFPGRVPKLAVVVVTPSLLKPVCSQMYVSDFVPGLFDANGSSAASPAEAEAPLTLSSDRSVYYLDEPFIFHAVVGQASAQATSGGSSSCPPLFLLVRFPDGEARMDEIHSQRHPHSAIDPQCHLAGQPTPSAAQVKIDNNTAYLSLGVRTYRLFQLTEDVNRGRVYLASSNALQVEFKDPSTAHRPPIQRTWGAAQKGVRVGLTLDSLTYPLGEDIPLHFAAEVLSAEQPVYLQRFMSTTRTVRLGQVLQLHILDEDGPLPGTDRPAYLNWFGTGNTRNPYIQIPACPTAIPPDKVLSLDTSLQGLLLLPNRPGTYKLYVSWSPYTSQYSSCDKVQPDPGASPEKPFVTVTSAPLMIHITGTPPPRDFPEFPEYTAWKSQFSVTDTSFGEQTALFDEVTRLEWLRVTLTRGYSEESLRDCDAARWGVRGLAFCQRRGGRQVLRSFHRLSRWEDAGPINRTKAPAPAWRNTRRRKEPADRLEPKRANSANCWTDSESHAKESGLSNVRDWIRVSLCIHWG